MTVTLNISREQIVDLLREGKTVEEISTEFSEPRANVYAVQRELQAAAAPAARPGPSVVVRQSPPIVVREPTPADLVAAAARSASKRTRDLGAKLDLLVEDLTGRLAAERETAEQARREAEERAAAAAEVRRLEEQLAAARAKLKAPRTGGGTGSKPSTTGRSTRPLYDGGPVTSEVRAWALANGIDCPAHGTLPARVIAAYREAHE